MRLAAGDWAAELRPAAGGAIASLSRRGVDILRPTPEDATDPLAFASFPLVPYANRIGGGAFEVEGVRHLLPCNYPRQLHPLHGVGWLSKWSVEAADDAHVTLLHRHDGDAAWPWRYAATQRFALDPTGLTVALELENCDARAMPASLGFHPYLVRSGVRAIAFDAAGLWQVDTALLPVAHVAADTLGDWSAGAALDRADLIDHCYTGWAGTVRIDRADGAITLTGSGTPMLHLYLPPDAPFFCAEPVSAMPNAVNHGAADRLQPGECRTIAMTIRG